MNSPDRHHDASAPLTASPASSQQMLELLTRNVGATIAVIDRGLRFAYVNDSYANWFGMTPAQMVGMRIRDVYGEHNHARYMPFVERTLAGEKVRYQRQVRNPAGIEEWHTICLSPCRDATGAIVGIVAAALDVHELKVATDALRTANQRLSSHMDNSPLAVVELDDELRLLHCSNKACELFGWGEDKVAGQPLPALLGAEPGEHAPLRLALNRLQRREEAQNRVEATHRRADGSTVHCQWFNSALTGALGDVESIMSLVEDVTVRVEAARKLHYVAQHDSLTNLLNRYAFLAELEASLARARRTGGTVALLFIDLDGFKHINDNHGHGPGDHLLREVARRLVAAVRETDTVARLGGDEFVVLLDTEVTHETADMVCRRVFGALRPPFPLAGSEVAIDASIGVAMHPPLDGEADRLMNSADQAMYAAKRAGKGCVRHAS